MSPSRRTTFGLFGTAAATLLAGCLGSGANGTAGATAAGTESATTDERGANGTRDTPATADDGGTDGDDTAAGDESAPAVEMRLVGPATDRTLFTDAGVERVGEVREQRTGAYGLPVTLTDAATADVRETMRAAGVAENPDEFEVVLRYDGAEVNRFGVTKGLAVAISEGDWDGEFLLVAEERATAESLRETLSEE